MPTKIFISHVDWNVKTPFVSYSDEKFVKELENINLSPVVIYFEKRAKISNRYSRGIYNFFINVRKNQVKLNLLEKERKLLYGLLLWSV